jgi:hypothetical protein
VPCIAWRLNFGWQTRVSRLNLSLMSMEKTMSLIITVYV